MLNPDARRIVGSMADAIAHRGPDGYGVWTDNENGVALAHRRLAILDLSPAGDQPMQDTSGRFVIVFNGEIYNHLDLRAELEAGGGRPNWRGHSDTETLLAAVWGYVDGSRSRTLDAYVRRLRLKCEQDPANPVRIITIHGVGYRFRGPLITGEGESVDMKNDRPHGSHADSSPVLNTTQSLEPSIAATE